MKFYIKLMTFFALVFICACAVAAEGYRDCFYKGNIAYERGDYKEAAKEYEDFLGRGVDSGNIYYNLGNAYYKLGNVGKSILYYEKALKLMPNDADTAANLSFVRTNIEDKPEEQYQPWLLKRLDFFFTGISLDGLTLLCALFFWLALAAGTVFLLIKDRWIGGWKLGTTFGAAFIILFSILLVRLAYFESEDYAVVTDKEVEARYGPTEGDAAAFTLHEGSKVRVENRTQDWLQIQFSAGKAGWVRKSSVEII